MKMALFDLQSFYIQWFLVVKVVLLSFVQPMDCFKPMLDLMSYLKLCGTVAKTEEVLDGEFNGYWFAENDAFVLYALFFERLLFLY